MSGSAIVLRSPLRLIGRMTKRGAGLIEGAVAEEVVARALGGTIETQGQREVGKDLGTARFAEEADADLVGGEVALPAVAGDATGDNVVPSLVAAPRNRDHVVEGELPGREAMAAILAAVVVASVDVGATEGDVGKRAFHPDVTEHAQHPSRLHPPRDAAA